MGKETAVRTRISESKSYELKLQLSIQQNFKDKLKELFKPFSKT